MTKVRMVTNSLRMQFNFRSKLIDDLNRKGHLEILLTSEIDCSPKNDGSIIKQINLKSNSNRLVDFFLDIVRVFIQEVKSEQNPTVVFTVRNVLLFGLVNRCLGQKVEIAYIAGLGRWMSASHFRNYFYQNIFVWIFGAYKKVIVLNKRDFELFSMLKHPGLKKFNGEGYDFFSPLRLRPNTNKKFDFGFVGRGTIQKGFDKYLDLAKRYPNYSFCMIGQVDEKLIKKVEGIDNIHILGFIESKDKIWNTFKCHLFLSHQEEGLPFVLLESIQYQIPTIAIDNPTIDEICKDFRIPVRRFSELVSDLSQFYKTSQSLVYKISLDLNRKYSYDNNNYKLVGWLNGEE
jgi:glycosyltransferase involved in cell wall biosynthesis